MASGTVTKLATRFPHTEVMRIYLAAPLVTVAERAFNADLARRLEARLHRVFLPQPEDPPRVRPLAWRGSPRRSS